MKGSQESLSTVVVKDAANWLTPQSGDVTGSTQEAVVMWANGKRPKTSDQRLRTQVAAEQLKYGQAAPANPSTDGSRQELLVDWRTPQANEAGARVETLYTKDGQPARPGERAYRKTPDGRMVLQSQTINQQVEMVQNWATPRAGATESSRPNNKGGIPLADQAKREQEKMWRTPSVAEEKNQNTSTQIYLQNQVGATPKNWATPIMGDSHLASTPEVAQKRIEEGKVTLSRQNPGKLNPRWVESLQGVCMGWTSPSCPASVIKNWPKFVSGWCALTIEPTSYASSATESCLPPPSELFAF
jgi:hypothetical protein